MSIAASGFVSSATTVTSMRLSPDAGAVVAAMP
jgi:hypothetical protein